MVGFEDGSGYQPRQTLNIKTPAAETIPTPPKQRSDGEMLDTKKMNFMVDYIMNSRRSGRGMLGDTWYERQKMVDDLSDLYARIVAKCTSDDQSNKN